jgi:hypothetical protein
MNTNKSELEAETPGKKDWLCHKEEGGIVAFECVCGMFFRDSDYLTK